MKKIFVILAAICLLSACGGREVKELTKEDIKEYASKLSDDPLSGQFFLNEEKYEDVIKTQDILDKGFQMDSSKEEAMPAYTMTKTPIKLYNGKSGKENSIYINVKNKTSDEVSIKEASVYEIIIENDNGEQKNTLVLPKGITLASSYEDILKAYGEPKVNYLEKAGFIYYYGSDYSMTNKKLEFHFDNDKKTVVKIVMHI